MREHTDAYQKFCTASATDQHGERREEDGDYDKDTAALVKIVSLAVGDKDVRYRLPGP